MKAVSPYSDCSISTKLQHGYISVGSLVNVCETYMACDMVTPTTTEASIILKCNYVAHDSYIHPKECKSYFAISDSHTYHTHKSTATPLLFAI